MAKMLNLNALYLNVKPETNLDPCAGLSVVEAAAKAAR